MRALRYLCQRGALDNGEPRCIGFGGVPIDTAISREVLRVVQPAERQWGTVREDYSPNGTAWEHFPHDHARSRAYRWGEDGTTGWGDDHLRWCLGIALWNGRDSILKERMFGLTNSEGNHSEHIKELWYFQDRTPTHSYMRMLYKYPQAEFPYARLVAENRARIRHEPEFEIYDTGIFDEGRYFDMTVEYAKASPGDILMRITVVNRGPDEATLHLLPQLWARNMWSSTTDIARARIRLHSDHSVETAHHMFPRRRLFADGAVKLLFCENETNHRRLSGLAVKGCFKDGINDYIVHGDKDAVSPYAEGSKCAFHCQLTVAAGGSASVRTANCPPMNGHSAMSIRRCRLALPGGSIRSIGR